MRAALESMSPASLAMTWPARHQRIAGVAEYTMKASTRLAPIPRSNPAAEPRASNLSARPKAAFSTWVRSAPRAMRIPNSRNRLLTEYAAIPKMPVTGQHRPHHSQHAEGHGRHVRAEQNRVQFLVPSPRRTRSDEAAWRRQNENRRADSYFLRLGGKGGANGIGQPVPSLGFLSQTPAPRACQFVELGATVVL